MPGQIKIETKRTSQINVGTARKQKCEHKLISIYKRKVKMDNINVLKVNKKIADIITSGPSKLSLVVDPCNQPGVNYLDFKINVYNEKATTSKYFPIFSN